MANWNQLGSSLINKLSDNFAHSALTVFEDVAINITGSVIAQTPVGIEEGGKLKANWQISETLNDRVLTSSNKSKSGSFAQKKIRGKFAAVNMQGVKRQKSKILFLFNNSPYANTVEYGGYPDPVELGTFNRRAKKYEIRSQRGYSKQAPVGMVRTNVLNFKNRMKSRAGKL